MMIGMVAYMVYNARKYRWGSHCVKYGPAWLTFIASLLVMADLSRHVLQDYDVWPAGQWPGSSQYRSNCETEDMECLSAVGWIFTVVCTYSGFAILFFATMWNAKICEKIKDFRQKWRELRAGANAETQPLTN